MHCHIDLYSDPTSVLERAHAAGVYVLSVTTTPKAWVGTKNLAKSYPRVKTALGLHPQLAHERHGELSLFERLIDEVEYVGEVGLDFSKGFKQHSSIQLKVFTHVLDVAQRSGGKILSVHSRNSATAVLDCIESTQNTSPVILHWFTGTRKELKRAIELDCWFSVGPKMMQSKKALDLVREMPMHRLLFETDGPFARSNLNVPLEPVDTLSMPKLLNQHLGFDAVLTRKLVLENFSSLVKLKPNFQLG